jgi:murein DD-endopeptidase MepM/ murein hydrolase activator NlpD
VIAALLLVALLGGGCLPPPVDAPVAAGFRAPACDYCAGHRGLAYRVAPGTVVHAIAGGEVTFAGLVAGVRWVVVRHADGLRASYGGLGAVLVRRGQVVASGQPVGLSGASLHLGLRDREAYVDPASFVGQWVGRPRLVPVDGSPGRSSADRRLSCPATGARRHLGR